MPSLFDQFTTSRPGAPKRSRRTETYRKTDSNESNNPPSPTLVNGISAQQNETDEMPTQSPSRATMLAKDARSCPSLPLTDEADDVAKPVRRGSMPASRSQLPLLNLGALGNHCAVQDELRTPRRRVEAIGRGLSKFRSYLYVGGDAAARDLMALRRAGVTHVANLAGKYSANYHGNEMKYLRLYCRDDAREDFMPSLEAVAAFVDGARMVGGCVLVHCKQGISRSVTACLAYVLWREGITLDEAMMQMRQVRPIANPNVGFFDELREIERAVREGLRKPRVLIMRKQCTEEDAVWVPLKARKGWDDREGYVLQRGKRLGVVAWKGVGCPERVWKMVLDVARRAAEQEKRDRDLFGGGGGGAVRIVRHGEDAEIEEELKRVLIS